MVFIILARYRGETLQNNLVAGATSKPVNVAVEFYEAN